MNCHDPNNVFKIVMEITLFQMCCALLMWQCRLPVFAAPSAREIGAANAARVEVSIIRLVAAVLERWRSQKEEQDAFVQHMARQM